MYRRGIAASADHSPDFNAVASGLNREGLPCQITAYDVAFKRHLFWVPPPLLSLSLSTSSALRAAPVSQPAPLRFLATYVVECDAVFTNQAQVVDETDRSPSLDAVHILVDVLQHQFQPHRLGDFLRAEQQCAAAPWAEWESHHNHGLEAGCSSAITKQEEISFCSGPLGTVVSCKQPKGEGKMRLKKRVPQARLKRRRAVETLRTRNTLAATG